VITMPDLEIHYSGQDWAALYSGGALVANGHDHTVEEAALSMCDVKLVNDDAFLRGGNGTGRNGTPPIAATLDEVHEYADQRDTRLSQAAEMRAQAARLLADAETLEG
jgi:hypothetical protein